MEMNEADPSVDACNELLDWIEEHNDIDLNHVRFRIRSSDEPPSMYIVTCEWKFRGSRDRPKASEILIMPGWVIDKWTWNGENWTTVFWRV